jgi:hypothetical protein
MKPKLRPDAVPGLECACGPGTTRRGPYPCQDKGLLLLHPECIKMKTPARIAEVLPEQLAGECDHLMGQVDLSRQQCEHQDGTRGQPESVHKGLLSARVTADAGCSRHPRTSCGECASRSHYMPHTHLIALVASQGRDLGITLAIAMHRMHCCHTRWVIPEAHLRPRICPVAGGLLSSCRWVMEVHPRAPAWRS